ncbi:MAG TPA: DnaD domain protein [Candidatus Aphodoplasma excrementigallinarum]|uniref:DnaD domain protein n=1 Tax=Candidatus Aphodoplasma excrementigallinarum TaxID=2840673 RepID=A0A9D1NFK4_9FIRM|nr:DnaD domain protein [Candidatus Aphodoplasma excrementigallinarum]
MAQRGVEIGGQALLRVLPGLDGECVKLYIYIKYLSEQNGGTTSVSEVGRFLSMPGERVGEAVRELVRQGLIRLGAQGSLSLCPEAGAHVPLAEEAPSYRPGEVGAILESDKQLSDMLALAQKILGRTLSYSAIEKLYGLYDWLGMAPELILRLLEYCVELGKKDMRYIEKVALSWHEMGIGTVAEAERYIERQSYKRTYLYQIQKEFGIADRKLTASETRYIGEWYTMGVPVELAAFAYDYSVTKTGRLAMAYINKVLQAWMKEGIRTAEQAQESLKRRSAAQQPQAGKQNQAKPFEVYGSGRYDYEEIDALARRKLKKMIGKE